MQDACSDLAERLAIVPGGKVTTTNGPFADEVEGCERSGCTVALAGRFSALHGEGSADVWLRDYLQAKGWQAIPSHDADGPDGTVYGLRKPGALCIVEGRWNHWDDERGSHTEDGYRVTVSCGGATQ